VATPRFSQKIRVLFNLQSLEKSKQSGQPRETGRSGFVDTGNLLNALELFAPCSSSCLPNILKFAVLPSSFFYLLIAE
jgi:hypothetical protein